MIRSLIALAVLLGATVLSRMAPEMPDLADYIGGKWIGAIR